MSMELIKYACKYIDEQNYSKSVEILESVDVTHLVQSTENALEQCFEKIPESFKKASMKHCIQEMTLLAMKGNFSEAQKWFNALVSLREGKKEGTPVRAKLENYICWANMIKPNIDNAQIMMMMAIIFNENADIRPSLMLSITGKRPSVLFGRKDFSDWGKNNRAVKSIISPMLVIFPNKLAEGACAVANAELFYQKNKINEASIEIAEAISSSNADIAFAALNMLAKLKLFDVSFGKVDEVLERIDKMIQEKQADWLIPNYMALKARFAICFGNIASIEEWLTECTCSEMDNCCPGNFYEMSTKAYAYIALGRYRDAATLLQSLLILSKQDNRPMDTIACLVSSAIACDKMGSEDLAFEKLQKALEIAQPYGYIRVFADHGRSMFQLISNFEKRCNVPAHLNRIADSIKEASRLFSLSFPLIFASVVQADASPELTQAETQVLQMLGDGKSNNEIAEALVVKLPTVKFHMRNLFEKFDVSKRTELIFKAKNMKLI